MDELNYNTPTYSDSDTICPVCDGLGRVPFPIWNSDDECYDVDTEKCSHCKGEGYA
jgi:hypothetical protein